MKKPIFFTIIILLVTSAAVLTGETGKRNVCFHKVQAFMEEYFSDYNLHAQDAATIDLMDKYWAPEFISIQFLPLPEYPVFDRTTWKYFLVGLHLELIETLTMDELSIDTKNLTAVARLTIDFHHRMTGEPVLRKGERKTAPAKESSVRHCLLPEDLS